jgi:hypothetical protein
VIPAPGKLRAGIIWEEGRLSVPGETSGQLDREARSVPSHEIDRPLAAPS